MVSCSGQPQRSGVADQADLTFDEPSPGFAWSAGLSRTDVHADESQQLWSPSVRPSVEPTLGVYGLVELRLPSGALVTRARTR